MVLLEYAENVQAPMCSNLPEAANVLSTVAEIKSIERVGPYSSKHGVSTGIPGADQGPNRTDCRSGVVSSGLVRLTSLQLCQLGSDAGLSLFTAIRLFAVRRS